LRGLASDEFLETLFGGNGFYEYILHQIKQHREQLDVSNPRDYLDVLMIEAENNSSMGYATVCQTMIGLYLGASDTLSNTLRWLVLILAEFPDVQEKCYHEVRQAFDVEGEVIKEKCPYLKLVVQ